jgi:hypothetical protein
VRQDDEATLAPLRAALLDQSQALLSSMAGSASALRGRAPEPGTGLAEAQAALEAQLDAIRGQRELAPTFRRRSGPTSARARVSRPV